MEYLKKYPKMAYASLGLLVVAVLLMWTDWLVIGQGSVVGSLLQWGTNMGGGISLAEGCSVALDLAELSKRANSLYSGLVGGTQETISLVQVLCIAYIALFCGTIASVGYCFYARLKWASGLREGIYFLFFAGDIGAMFLLLNMLNKVSAGTFKMGAWGFVALGCALLSEILWEEASFNTPKPGTAAWDERMELIRRNKER